MRYQEGVYWSSGSEISYGGPGGRWWVNLSGGVCREYGLDAVLRVMREAMIGGTCTRLDICRDIKGEGLTLVGDAIASARAGFLRRLRSWRPFEILTADNQLEGIGAWFGAHGSPILHRAYDKGLETGTLRAGCWHRWEVQLRQPYSTEVAVQLVTADADSLPGVMLSALSGSIDFRVGPRDGFESLDALPRCAWWSSFIGAGRVQLRAPERDEDLEAWCGWARCAWVPVLVEAARRASVSPCQLLEALTAGVRISEGTRKNRVVDKLGPYLLGSYPQWRQDGEGKEEGGSEEGDGAAGAGAGHASDPGPDPW